MIDKTNKTLSVESGGQTDATTGRAGNLSNPPPARPSSPLDTQVPPRPRADLDCLRRIAMAEIPDVCLDDREGRFRLSDEAWTEVVGSIRTAVAEISYYRTLYSPGFVGEDGPRFSMDDDSRPVFNRRNPQGLG